MSWIDRARGRGDDADAARQHGQRPLARGVEQALLLELLLQLLEGLLQRALAERLQHLDRELVLALAAGRRAAAPRASTFMPSLGLNLMSRASPSSRPPRGPARSSSLSEKYQWPEARHGEVRDLALDPDVEELGLQHALEAVGQLADGPGAALRLRLLRPRPEVEPLLLLHDCPHSTANGTARQDLLDRTIAAAEAGALCRA